VAALLAQLDADSGRFFAAEGSRMARVQRNFVIIEYVELAIIVLAAVVAKGRPTLTGVALGLLLHAAFLLAFDLTAERRGGVSGGDPGRGRPRAVGAPGAGKAWRPSARAGGSAPLATP
jgi:hypothetical protein